MNADIGPVEQYDIDEAVADCRAIMRRTDPVTLQTVRLGEDYGKGLAAQFPPEQWPIVARAVMVSSAMNPSIALHEDGRPRADLCRSAHNIVTLQANIAACGSVWLLDEIDRRAGDPPAWQPDVDALGESTTWSAEIWRDAWDALVPSFRTEHYWPALVGMVSSFGGAIAPKRAAEIINMMEGTP